MTRSTHTSWIASNRVSWSGRLFGLTGSTTGYGSISSRMAMGVGSDGRCRRRDRSRPPARSGICAFGSTSSSTNGCVGRTVNSQEALPVHHFTATRAHHGSPTPSRSPAVASRRRELTRNDRPGAAPEPWKDHQSATIACRPDSGICPDNPRGSTGCLGRLTSAHASACNQRGRWNLRSPGGPSEECSGLQHR